MRLCDVMWKVLGGEVALTDEAYWAGRSRGLFRISAVGLVLTVFNVALSMVTAAPDRKLNDVLVGVGIMAGFVVSLWAAKTERLNGAALSAAVGIWLPVWVGDLAMGRYTERLLYMLLAVIVAGSGLNLRMYGVFYGVVMASLVGLVWMTPGRPISAGIFSTFIIDLAALMTGAAVLFGINMRVTLGALEASRARERSLALAHERAELAASSARVANESKSMFLANVSHELRTPLNAIIGYVELIEEEAQGSDEAFAFHDELGRVHTSARSLLGLIDEVLDLSKVEAGRMELVMECFEVSRLLDAVQSTILPLARAQQNTLRCVQVSGPLELETDLLRLRQVLLNLLSNACKFTRGGEIELRVEAAREVGGEREWVAIHVSDTGIGMHPEQLERIFEPFAQGSASTSHVYGGTGLGLALSERICVMLGGSITARSVEGEGTTLTLLLPARSSLAAREACAM